MIEFIQPYSFDLNSIGDAYSHAISKCEDWIAMFDQDTLKPPGFAERINQVLKTAKKDTIYGAMTNRVGWKHPGVVKEMFMEDSITKHIEKANELWDKYGTKTEPCEVVPGYCMIFHRELAETFLPLPNGINFDRIISANRKTVLMKGIYIIHLYRWGLKNPSPQIEHLKKQGTLLRKPLLSE